MNKNEAKYNKKELLIPERTELYLDNRKKLWINSENFRKIVRLCPNSLYANQQNWKFIARSEKMIINQLIFSADGEI